MYPPQDVCFLPWFQYTLSERLTNASHDAAVTHTPHPPSISFGSNSPFRFVFTCKLFMDSLKKVVDPKVTYMFYIQVRVHTKERGGADAAPLLYLLTSPRLVVFVCDRRCSMSSVACTQSHQTRPSNLQLSKSFTSLVSTNLQCK